MTVCNFTNFVEGRHDFVATQYRESTNLLALIDNMITPLVAVGGAVCDAATFDIDTATGDQLTLLGKILGWPRVNCNGVREPVFGFECAEPCQNVAFNVGGFCEANWGGDDCPTTFNEFEFTDDELYRRFLKTIIFRHNRDYRRPALQAALVELLGVGAGILREEIGHTHVYTGRDLTTEELSIVHLFEQVLPIPPGLTLHVHQTNAAPFGFGDGWGEFCTGEFPIAIT